MSQQDVLRRFLFDELGVRGLWVSLSSSWQTAKRHQNCTDAVQLQLGQALSAVVLLSATIKFNGSMILQAQGDGPLKTLVAQATHDHKIRGLIRGSDAANLGSLQEMFGEGRLVLTIDSENAHPYQGIISLQGKNLAEALETYFIQSEQLNTRLWLFANETHAAGLLLQELPNDSNDKADWERIAMLASTVTEQEMLELDCEELLHRLFNEEKVRLFDGEAIKFDCSCSRPKIENALRMMGREELESVLHERGHVEVNCEFCNKHYQFDRIDVEQLLLVDKNIPADPHIKH
ncbi:Hsp33 family molecular chaperone HslO [Methyloglobulus sp.]|uniref:Hsp33 family molecular chaperone HslO n=1 Tax=Methyloglobulus sp. TaxID=2518622 RepID=UPI0032B85778